MQESTATVSSTGFTDCTAYYGGGMYLSGSDVTLIDLTMKDNNASNAPDIWNSESAYTCSTSCLPGQTSHCGDIASTNDGYECSVNCASCYACPAGTANAETGTTTNSSCAACAPGYVSTHAGATSCAGCDAGRYATDRETSTWVCVKGQRGGGGGGGNATLALVFAA